MPHKLSNNRVPTGTANMDSRNEAAYLFATQLVSASSFQAALKSAVELDLLELIKKSGPVGALLSPADLAAQLPTTNPAAPDMLDRILRLLAAHSILKCSLKTLPNGGVERQYSLEPVCEFLTKNEDGVSLAPMFLLSEDKAFKASSDELKDAVLHGGIPFHKAHGMSIYKFGGKDPRFNSVFNKAMSNHSTLLTKKILEAYDGFARLKSVVDVGGGTGETLNMIISKYPSIKGVNFDLRHVIERAPSHAGVEHVAGDMFVSVPNGDAIFMKWICHNWSDEECLKLLGNCREAIPETGKVIMVESILSSAHKEQLATMSVLQLDVIMMTQIGGGRQRTEMEFQALAKGAGFRGFRKACRAYNFWIMELEK